MTAYDNKYKRDMLKANGYETGELISERFPSTLG